MLIQLDFPFIRDEGFLLANYVMLGAEKDTFPGKLIMLETQVLLLI